jgi:PAS domain S-box-containing protein
MSYLGKGDPVHLPSPQIRVLHVDDQRDLADLTAEFLERENDDITVVTETNVQNGLDRLATEPIDCIVSDYEMSGQNGLEFLERVRAEHGDIPFILFTGKGSEEIASEAISAGVTDYLQKESGTDQYTVLANRIANAVEHHRSRRTVEATEEKLLQLAERTDDILFMFDGAWEEVLFVNSAYEDLWGGSIAELRDDPTAFLDYIHHEDRDSARESLERLQHGEADTIEYRVITDDGDQRWVRGQTKPIFDDDGTVSRITGFVRDITDRKTREQELEARATAMEAATDGIAILNDDQEYVFMNDAHAAIYGFDDPDELLGKSWRACYDDPDIAQFETEILPQLSETGEWHGNMTVTAANGQTIHQDLDLQQLDDGRVVCVVRDVTDRIEREQAVRDLHETARELVQAETPEEVSEITVEAFRDVLDMPANTVHLYDEEEDGLVPIASTAAGQELVGEIPTFHPGEGIAWEVFETGEPQVYDDVSTATGRINPETVIKSELILPLGEHGVLLIGLNEAMKFD